MSYCSIKCTYCFANLNDPKRAANPKAIMSLLQKSENKNARLVTRAQRHPSHADPALPAPVKELALPSSINLTPSNFP